MIPSCPHPDRALAHPSSMLRVAMAMALVVAAGAAQAGKAPKPSQPLNDTGATKCIVNNAFTKECAGTGQDGEYGRDVTNKNNKNGTAGFAYIKVCNSGELAGAGNCPSDPALGTGAANWGCTQDKVTKLIWEVKTADGGLRDWLKTYTNWNDGKPGDVSEFVAQVNAQGLCGAKDWKLPSSEQLQGLVNLGIAYPGPTIDPKWFPNTVGGNNAPAGVWYWTPELYRGDQSRVWAVDFFWGQIVSYDVGRDRYHAARLVRSGQ
jgi:hypothetical protein